MSSNETVSINFYNEVRYLIEKGEYIVAEAKLRAADLKTAQWHFLYSLILINKAWFDSAKEHLEKAVSMAPDSLAYHDALAELMGRYSRYSDDYYRRPYYHRRRGCCCCCCDDCCHFSCCDLICLDTCCECMGGDLIECI